MALDNVRQHVFLALVISFACFQSAISGDPDIIFDFLSPPNATGQFFTFTGMRTALSEDQPTSNFSVRKSKHGRVPRSQMAREFLMLFCSTLTAREPSPHHSPAAELLFLLYGVLDVGFVDTTNKLYAQTLQAGDTFVFPKGLVHHQFNSKDEDVTIAVSAFGSASAGTVSVPAFVFATGIDDAILARSFKTDVATIQKIKAGLASHKA